MPYLVAPTDGWYVEAGRKESLAHPWPFSIYLDCSVKHVHQAAGEVVMQLVHTLGSGF